MAFNLKSHTRVLPDLKVKTIQYSNKQYHMKVMPKSFYLNAWLQTRVLSTDLKLLTILFFFPSQLIKFLRDASVVIQLWGKQVVDKKPVNVAAKKGKNTKAIMRAETLKKNVSTQ